MKKVVILGGTGAGMIAASIINRKSNLEVLGFLNDNINNGKKIGRNKKKYEVIGNTNDINKVLENKNTYAFVAYEGISNPHRSYEAWKSLDIPKSKYINIIDDMSVMPEGFSEIGVGVMFAPFAQISPDSKISDNCMLLGNAFVGHDSFIDEFSHITTNSVVGAHVHVGKGVTIGMNSTIRGRVKIGDFSLVGAGSVVLEDVPPNTIVAGNPAKVIKKRGELNYLSRENRF